jgi:hypothetical protein
MMGNPHAPRPHETIPNTFAHVWPDSPPPGYHVGEATYAELQTAGFHGGEMAEPKPGTAPADDVLVEGHSVTVGPDEARNILAAARLVVLRDPSGAIVATWDEGRWWTPEESDAFSAAIAAELSAGR